MTKRLQIPVKAAQSAQAATENADILITCTSSKDPVVFGDWLRKGTHVNLVGAMKPTRREIDDRAVQVADLVVVDDLAQSKIEAGELIPAAAAGLFDWRNARELADVVANGKPASITDDSIILFKSHGVGIWDVAVGAHVLKQAKSMGIGRNLPIEHPATPLYKGKAFGPSA